MRHCFPFLPAGLAVFFFAACTAGALDLPYPDGFLPPTNDDMTMLHDGGGLFGDAASLPDGFVGSHDGGSSSHGDGGGGGGEVPDPYDLRFKWIGAYETASSATLYAFRSAASAPNQALFYDQPSGWLPMQMGLSELTFGMLPDPKPGAALWLAGTFLPTGKLLQMNSLAKAGPTDMLHDDIDMYVVKQRYVITSIDISYAPDAFYSFSGATTIDGAYLPQPRMNMDRSQLDAFAASEGMHSRVVTALTTEGTQLLVFSSGKKGDTFVYETMVLEGTIDDLSDLASMFAAGGYAITAMGRDSSTAYSAATPFVLVGTRRQGTSTPWETVVQALPAGPKYALPSGDPSTLVEDGYTIVGWAWDGMTSWAVGQRAPTL